MRRCVHWEEAQRVDTCPLCRSLISSRICMDGRVIVQEPRRSWPRAFQTASGAERSRAFLVSKPVVYLYPPHPLVAEVTVTVVPNSKLVVLIPTPNRESRGTGSVTWAVEAQPDGTLTLLPAPEAVPSAPEDPLAPRSPRGEGPGASQAAAVVVSSLFWESEFTGHLRGAPSRASAVGCRPAADFVACSANRPLRALNAGPCATGSAAAAHLWGLGPDRKLRLDSGCFCVSGQSAGDWLLAALPRLGLSVREYTEMATFWGVLMQARSWLVAKSSPFCQGATRFRQGARFAAPNRRGGIFLFAWVCVVNRLRTDARPRLQLRRWPGPPLRSHPLPESGGDRDQGSGTPYHAVARHDRAGLSPLCRLRLQAAGRPRAGPSAAC